MIELKDHYSIGVFQDSTYSRLYTVLRVQLRLYYNIASLQASDLIDIK